MKELQRILKEYSDYVFRLALTHLFAVGINKIKDIDIESAAKECEENTPDGYIMTGEFRANILRCAYEIAQIPMWDVLKFVQQKIRIDNVTVHPGVYVQFRDNEIGEEICSCVLPADVTEFDIDEVTEAVAGMKQAYKDAHGSLHGFSVKKAIEEALRNKGIRSSEIPYDHKIYV